jgi:hypothetical protein
MIGFLVLLATAASAWVFCTLGSFWQWSPCGCVLAFVLAAAAWAVAAALLSALVDDFHKRFPHA